VFSSDFGSVFVFLNFEEIHSGQYKGPNWSFTNCILFAILAKLRWAIPRSNYGDFYGRFYTAVWQKKLIFKFGFYAYYIFWHTHAHQNGCIARPNLYSSFNTTNKGAGLQEVRDPICRPIFYFSSWPVYVYKIFIY